jgi:high affinity sulfate transporter 1
MDQTTSTSRRLPTGGPVTHIVRPTYNEQQFYSGFRPIDGPTPRSLLQSARNLLPNWKLWLLSRLPIIQWLRDYPKDWKNKLVGDIAGGITTGIMMIPQGLAYAQLSSVEPVYGLYSNLFPVLIYVFLGTSMHVSIGVFAVINILVGNAIKAYGNTGMCHGSGDNKSSLSQCHQPIDVAVALTFAVGIVQLGMFFLRLGFFTNFLSTPLVGGFTTGAAFHVGTSQLKHIFGLNITRQSSIATVPLTWGDILGNLGDTNAAAFLVSIICIAFLLVMKFINTKYQKKLKFPIPGELIAVIIGAGVSYGAHLHDKYNVVIVDHIPSGLPTPFVPKAALVGYMFLNYRTYVIAIVSYGLTISVCKLFAKKFKYALGMNQELFAHGVTNVFSSFFSCMVASGSLTRTVVYANVGGRTLLGSVISGLIVLVVLLVVAPLFEPLPNAILGSIVLVALRGLLMQFRDIRKLYYISKSDLFVWLVSFFGTVLISVSIGLGLGIFAGMLTILWHSFMPYYCLLGQIPETDLYRDLSRFEDVHGIPGIKIFRFESSLSFANSERFRRKLLEKARVNLSVEKVDTTPENISVLQDDNEARHNNDTLEMSGASVAGPEGTHRLHHTVSVNSTTEEHADDCLDCSRLTPDSTVPTHTAIIDCTVFTFIDSVSVEMICELSKELEEYGVQLLLAGCRWRVRERLQAGGYMSNIGYDHLFVTIHDAVVFALHGDSLINQNVNGRESESLSPRTMEESGERSPDNDVTNYETSV